MGFLQRLWAMMVKEARQLRRDRLTFGMMFGIPIMQLVLFGFAINTDPKGLPAAILAYDHSHLSRAIISSIGTTGYFAFVAGTADRSGSQRPVAAGRRAVRAHHSQ
jgi:ABC-2 type transport system permease protein